MPTQESNKCTMNALLLGTHYNVLRWCSGGRKLKWGGWNGGFGGGSAAASSGAAASGGLFHISVNSLSPVVTCPSNAIGNEVY